MGKLNEIQEQTTQSWGDNSFITTITNDTVEFDSARDSFTFKDEVNVPSLAINGQTSQPFTSEEKTKLSQVTTPMNMAGRVDSASELPTEDVQVGDVYLVGLSGSENFEEYVCAEISGSPEAPVWENLGHVKVQSDWNQNNSNADDFIKHRICYDARYSVSYLETTVNQYALINDTFNALRPMTAGVYKIVVGDNEETANLQLSDAGGGHLTGNKYLSQGSVSVNYYSGEGNGTITVNFSGNPSVYGNKTFKIVAIEGNLVTIDNKYLGFYITGGSGEGSIIESCSYNTASGENSHAEGYQTTASGDYSHAEGGDTTTASGKASHAEGSRTTASNANSHAEGYQTKASGPQSHAEGASTTASGPQSHAECYSTTASGDNSHAEGGGTKASGVGSHAEGFVTTATGCYSHTEGNGTIANNKCQHVFGEYNGVDPSSALSSARGTYIEIVGNGATATNRSNARTLDWGGNETLQGNLTIGGAITANGVKTNKITIAGINPADEYMYSEIMDASSDVALTKVLAGTSPTKTDGYVEILYKATTGVTCSAYIDSADVALTADGAWHKLEQGCNPSHGVEIHVNNSSPVTGATLEVISKVYYI